MKPVDMFQTFYGFSIMVFNEIITVVTFDDTGQRAEWRGLEDQSEAVVTHPIEMPGLVSQLGVLDVQKFSASALCLNQFDVPRL